MYGDIDRSARGLQMYGKEGLPCGSCVPLRSEHVKYIGVPILVVGVEVNAHRLSVVKRRKAVVRVAHVMNIFIHCAQSRVGGPFAMRSWRERERRSRKWIVKSVRACA